MVVGAEASTEAMADPVSTDRPEPAATGTASLADRTPRGDKIPAGGEAEPAAGEEASMATGAARAGRAGAGPAPIPIAGMADVELAG